MTLNITDELREHGHGDWESLWHLTWNTLTNNGVEVVCEIAEDEAIDYAASQTNLAPADSPEVQQRLPYYQMGYRLGALGMPLNRAIEHIQGADICVWADDDYILAGIQVQAVIAGWNEGNAQSCIASAQYVVKGQGVDQYEEPHEFVFAAICRLAAVYVHIQGDTLDGLLQAIAENLDADVIVTTPGI